MNNTKIELKDLVWKKSFKKTELDELELKWRELSYNSDISTNSYIFNNAEQIAKEKAEILNKQYEYTKDNIIEMFVNAGFEWLDNFNKLSYKSGNWNLDIHFRTREEFWFSLDDNTAPPNKSKFIGINDRKSIEFYYNKFREILEFEVENEKI